MKVGIDASALVRPGTGIGRYTEELVRGLGALPEGPELALLVNDRGDRPLPSALPGQVVNPRWPDRVLSFGWRHLGWPPVERFLGPMHVFHASDWSHPPQRSGASVSTVHDLAPLIHPEWYTPEVVSHHRTRLTAVSRKADMVITVSEHTRADFLSHFPVSEDRVRAVPNGVSPFFHPVSEHEGEPELEALDVKAPFLLYVGSREARKNLPGLVEIFSLVREVRPDVTLVLAGMRPWDEAREVQGAAAWSGREIEERIVNLKLESAVRVAGHVSAAALRALYGRAAALVFPTLYEGFGLPVLEAMACGAPVVASNVSAVPEVVGRAGLTADPRDPEAFAGAVLRVLEEKGLSAELRTRGLVQAGDFGWDRTARGTAEVYRSAWEGLTSGD